MYVEFPKDWHVTCAANHWSNEETMMQYIDKILLPYIKRKREELQPEYNYPALVIFNNFTGQNTEQVYWSIFKTFLSILSKFQQTVWIDCSHLT